MKSIKRIGQLFRISFLLMALMLPLIACSDAKDDIITFTEDADTAYISGKADNTVYVPEESPEPAVNGTLFSNIFAQIEQQARVDETLLHEMNSSIHSFDTPYVVIDPYGMSPLTALALFSSTEPMNISIHIPGKTELADVNFTFSGYNTRHEIPIYGLYPNEMNMVELTGRTPNGEIKSVTLEIYAYPLPPVLEQNTIITNLVRPESYQPGFNFISRHKTAIDANGHYRWYYNDFGILKSSLFSYNGNMIFATGSYNEGDVLFFETNMLGKILNVYYSPYGVHHDIAKSDRNNLIVSGSSGDVVEDFVYEIDTATGEIINTLDLKRVLQRTRTSGMADSIFSTTNWFTHNFTVYNNGNIIISGGNQSAVVKLSWPDGDIKWILSDHSGWNPMFKKYLLTPIGDNFEWSYAPHTIQILQDMDNNPDTIDILVFDKGDGRFYHDRELQRAIANNEVVIPENYSRMVHYRINEREMTIYQIWQFGKELGEKYYAAFSGSAQMLENGNRLSIIDKNFEENDGSSGSSFIEVDSYGNIVWEAYATSVDIEETFTAYRGERRQLYTESADSLRIGVPAGVFITEEKLSYSSATEQR